MLDFEHRFTGPHEYRRIKLNRERIHPAAPQIMRDRIAQHARRIPSRVEPDDFRTPPE